VVLGHGGFVGGSGWQPVCDLLEADGYRVSVAYNPTLSLWARSPPHAEWSMPMTGRSCWSATLTGGAVITEVGTHPIVAALV
jgi:hypothetical protein